MILEIILSIIFGILIGIFTGITPGIHVNLVASAITTYSAFLLTIANPLSLCTFILSLAVTHSMLDTLPSTYLGAPDPSTALSVLPSQKMLLEGNGHEAVLITILGSYSGLIIAIIAIPIFLILAKIIYGFLKPYLLWLLIILLIYIIFRDKEWYWAIVIVALTGALGIAVFGLTFIKNPLFHMLSGLFGISGLILSLSDENILPEQQITKEINLEKKDLIKSNLGALISVSFTQFFPGLGPAQGAAISGQIFKNNNERAYLALVGSIGTMSVVFSLVTFYAINKAKDGSIVAIQNLIQLNLTTFIVLTLSFLIAGSIAVIITIFMSKKFSSIISKINYKLLCISIIAFIVILSFMFDGLIGLLILLTATAIGLISPLKGVARSHAMGCILIPVLLYLIL